MSNLEFWLIEFVGISVALAIGEIRELRTRIASLEQDKLRILQWLQDLERICDAGGTE